MDIDTIPPTIPPARVPTFELCTPIDEGVAVFNVVLFDMAVSDAVFDVAVFEMTLSYTEVP